MFQFSLNNCLNNSLCPPIKQVFIDKELIILKSLTNLFANQNFLLYCLRLIKYLQSHTTKVMLQCTETFQTFLFQSHVAYRNTNSFVTICDNEFVLLITYRLIFQPLFFDVIIINQRVTILFSNYLLCLLFKDSIRYSFVEL